MEQIGSGARHTREDAKPFYRNVTVIRNCDFLWNDGQRYMPTQSKLAQIRKSSVLGQYKNRFEFDQNMSEEMVVEKLEETFPYLRNKSYAFKVVTSRPPKCRPKSRIWNGKMIKRNTQGNSALYILEDEETQKNDSSAYLDQPKSKRHKDELTSLDQSQKAANELSSLQKGAPAISGQKEQPTSSGCHTRHSTSHRISTSRLAVKGAENGTLPGFIRLPQNQQSGNGTRSSDWYYTEKFGPTPQVVETDDNHLAGEGRGLCQEILPSFSSVTGPHPTSQQAPVMEKPAPGERKTISSSMLHQNYGTLFGLQTFSSTPTLQINTSNDLAVASQRSHQLCSAKAIETFQQLCSNETATEGLNLCSANLHLSCGSSLSHSSPPKFLTAETLGAENRALQSVTRLPQNQQSGNGTRSSEWDHIEVFGPTPKGLETGLLQERLPGSFWVIGPQPSLQQAPVMEKPVPGERNTISTSSLHQNYGTSLGLKEFSSTLTPQVNTSNDFAIASWRSYQLCSAEAMETSQQLCSNQTATEGLWSAGRHLSHGASRPDSTPPDTTESRLFQSTTLPPWPRAMFTSETSEVYDNAGFSSDILTTDGHSVFDTDSLLEELLPYDDIPDDVRFDSTVGPEKVPSKMPQKSPHETNIATNSSAPVALSNLKQPTLSDTSATGMVQNTLQPQNDYPIQEGNILNGPLATSTSCNLINPQHITDAVAFQNINQPSSSDLSTTVMAQNNMQSWDAFELQQGSILSEESASNSDFSMTEPQNTAPAADGGLDVDTMGDQWWKVPDFWDSQMADGDDPIGTLEIRDRRLLNQGSLLNSTVVSDSSADNHNTTSGISGFDHNVSSDDLSPHEDEHFDFSVEPKRVPLRGGRLCRFSSSRAFPRSVQSAFAIFENLGTVEVTRCGEDALDGEEIPPSKTPGWVTIFLQLADGKELGETKIWYYDEDEEAVERIIEKPKLQEYFFRKYREIKNNRNTTKVKGAEAPNSGICGSTESVEVLCVLVYAAAEIGGQQFIEMIFNSSAGRVVYDLYKDSPALPEAVAREYGHEKTATFLEEITGRFSKEANEAQNYHQTIDWSELVRAAEEAQKQPDLSTEEESNHLESNVQDTGYLGDIDTSFNESCESGSYELEDNIPWATSKEMNYLADDLREVALAHEDQEFGIKKAAVSQSLMHFCETGNFNREQVNSTVSNKVVLPTLEGWQLSFFQDSFIRKAYGLKHQRSVNRCDTSFFLSSEQESITFHLITEYERWCLLFKYMEDSGLHSRTFAAEGRQFVEQVNQETRAVMIGASFSCVEDLPFLQPTRELVTTSENPELTVQRSTTQGSTRHSTSSNLWVLTCLYRPARSILFVYVADNCDVLPQKAYFDDDRYELSTQCWQWQRYRSSLFDVQNRLQEMRKLSEQMSPEFGPTPLPTYSAKVLPQVQGKNVLRQPESCPTWLYTITHQCCVCAPTERPLFIAVFDIHSLSRTLGAHLTTTWLSQYDQGKYLPLKKCQSEDPCLVNDKTNHPSSNIDVTDHRSARKEKYEEHLHEDNESNVVCIDKHLLLQECINSLEECPLIAAHPSSKTFHEVSKGIGDAQNEVNVETSPIRPPHYMQMSQKQRIGLHDSVARSLSENRCLRKSSNEGFAEGTSLTSFNLTIDKDDENLYGVLIKNPGEGLSKSTSSIALPLGHLDGEWGKSLGEGLAKSTSLTAFTLTINSVNGNLDRDWGKGLGEGLAKSTSLTAFTLTINSVNRFLDGDWERGLGEGLAKSTSLTAFTLTINSVKRYLDGDWGRGLGEGLAKSTSLTAFTLTINSVKRYLGGDWGKGLGKGLANSTSLTAFTLTINSVNRYLDGDWGKGLGKGLAKSTSLTAFTLTIHSVNRYLDGDWGKGLGEGLARSTSLTAFTLTIHSVNRYLDGDWGKGLGEGLARSTSFIAFTLKINSFKRYLDGDWGKGLGEGLARSMSCTAFTLTINSVNGYLHGDWGKGLGEGLAKSTSFIAFTLTINSVNRYLDGDWGKGLGEGLAKSKSLTTLALKINSVNRYLDGDWGKGLGEGLANSTSLTAFTLTINNVKRYLDGDWGKSLGEGLAKSTSLTAFALTINSVNRYLDGDWGKGLGEGLAKSATLTAFTLTINSVKKHLDGNWGKGLGEGLAKSTSLTALTLIISSVKRYLDGDWGKGLGEGLAKSASLTAFTLTINSAKRYLDGDWGKGLGEGLAKSTSLTAFTLTINSVKRYPDADWEKDLGEGSANSTSLTAFTLTVHNNEGGYLNEDGGWVEGLIGSLRKGKFLLPDNVRIADSCTLDECFSLHDPDRCVRVSPSARSFNSRGEVQTILITDVTGSFKSIEKTEKGLRKKGGRCTFHIMTFLKY